MEQATVMIMGSKLQELFVKMEHSARMVILVTVKEIVNLVQEIPAPQVRSATKFLIPVILMMRFAVITLWKAQRNAMTETFWTVIAAVRLVCMRGKEVPVVMLPILPVLILIPVTDRVPVSQTTPLLVHHAVTRELRAS